MKRLMAALGRLLPHPSREDLIGLAGTASLGGGLYVWFGLGVALTVIGGLLLIVAVLLTASKPADAKETAT